MYQRAWAAAIAVLCKQRLFVSLFLATAGLASAQTTLATSDSAKNPDEVIPATEATDNAQAGADNASGGNAVATEAGATVLPEMVVTGEVKRDTHYTSPSSRVTRADIERQNAQTTEEVLKYQPSLQIRQRYIGDPNGVLGIRGADMFSTARNMVFADGLPLHNQLQASFNGAPRWSLVGPNEIDAVDIVYGPFSAEYSGNSIGGVVNFTTRMPYQREFYAEGSYFVQPWEFLGADAGTFEGNRQYVSAGNRFGDLSVFLAYNRLEAESQPQSYFIDNTGLRGPGPGQTPVTGAVPVLDTRGTPSLIFGDTGPEDVDTHLVKLKLGYDIRPDLQVLFTGAYESRDRLTESPRNYLRTASGDLYFGDNRPSATNPTGTNSTRDALFEGSAFNVLNNGFGLSEDDRETMILGLQLRGAVGNNWDIDTTASYVDVFEDTRATSFFNPNDPIDTGAGQIQDFETFNWKNYDFKLSTPALFGSDKLAFLGGYHFDNYDLGFKQFNLTNFSQGVRGAVTSRNEGETTTHGIFGQLAYYFLPDWDATVGARYEWWSGHDGVVTDRRGVSTPVPDRDESEISPKFSLGYEPGLWKFRYSFGQAYRFPVIAELYQSLSSPTSITTANALLKPEDGVHHNFTIEYGLPQGFVRLNVFRDDISDLIQSVRTVSGVLTESAFQNIDEASTTGVELIYDQQRILDSKFDFNFNVTWMDAKIDKGGDVVFTEANGTQNPFNLTGKDRIRLPEWRVNFFTTYHATEAWDLSLAGRYTSDSFNDIDNKDFVNGVFGAQDPFFFLDFKTSYRFKSIYDANTRVSFGVNNLTDDTAFVFHPYPQRTFFVEAALSF